MATINLVFNIADNQVASIKNDFASELGWTSTITNPNTLEITPNPESQNAFIKRNIGEYIKRVVKTKRMRDAAVVAEDAAETLIDSEVVLT